MKMKIEVTKKLSREIRNKHVAAQKSIANFANDKEEQGMILSIYAGMDVAAMAFLLAHLELNNNDVRETVDDFLGFITDNVMKRFTEVPHVIKIMEKEGDKEIEGLRKILDPLTEALKKDGIDVTPVVAGGTLQEIADQMQAMADAENQPKQ